ncbi:DUF305 domain-containing protein [Sphingomonadaceae bacterium OTU29LAMAA1]|nr:DUF305 domain-containing protein [Sphingomonadaceae bacterium OTU29LAMAA1]
MPATRRLLHLLLAPALAFGAETAFATIADTEQPYLVEMNAAMDRMMKAMMVSPTGDVDADFVTMMQPHHQGAIDMAVAELRYGKNEQLKRIAQEIIVDQQQEIAAMRLALGQPLPPSQAVPTQQGSTPHAHKEH